MEINFEGENIPFTDVKMIHRILLAILDAEREIDRDKEHYWGIGIDSRQMIRYIELISLGTVSESLAHPRETYRLAVLKSVPFLMIAHNHPSGYTEPSDSDVKLTRRMKLAGEILGIELLDHLVISGKTFYSFQDSAEFF